MAYPTPPRIADKDREIVLFFLKNDNKRTHASGIAEKSGNVSKSWSIERCNYLDKEGVLDHVMIKPARQKNETEYYHIAYTTYAVYVLADMFKHDSSMQQIFMNSQYYRDMIPVLVDEFEDSLADLRLSMRDIFRHFQCVGRAIGETEYSKQYLEPPEITRMTEPIHKFNDTESKKIKSSLTYNWSMLRFIMHYLYSDIQTRRQLMLNVLVDSQIITLAAGKALGMAIMANNLISTFIESGNGDALYHALDTYKEASYKGDIPPTWYVPDICKELRLDTEMLPVWAADELPCMWFTEFFDQMQWLCNRHTYTFD